MNLLEIVKQELATPNIPILDIRNLNNNINSYLEFEDDFDEKQKNEFIKSIIGMMQDISRKLPPENTYERFVRRLYDKDTLRETLIKIKKNNQKFIKGKQSETK